MFSAPLRDWLNANSTPRHQAWLRTQADAHLRLLVALGVSPDSELAQLYLQHGAESVRGWYALLQPEELADATAYAHEELGVPAHLLALSGVEGQGVVLHDPRTGAVYDVEFGQFEALEAGQLAPLADSVSAYLAWCQQRDAAR